MPLQGLYSLHTALSALSSSTSGCPSLYSRSLVSTVTTLYKLYIHYNTPLPATLALSRAPWHSEIETTSSPTAESAPEHHIFGTTLNAMQLTYRSQDVRNHAHRLTISYHTHGKHERIMRR